MHEFVDLSFLHQLSPVNENVWIDNSSEISYLHDKSMISFSLSIRGVIYFLCSSMMSYLLNLWLRKFKIHSEKFLSSMLS